MDTKQKRRNRNNDIFCKPKLLIKLYLNFVTFVLQTVLYTLQSYYGVGVCRLPSLSQRHENATGAESFLTCAVCIWQTVSCGLCTAGRGTSTEWMGEASLSRFPLLFRCFVSLPSPSKSFGGVEADLASCIFVPRALRLVRKYFIKHFPTDRQVRPGFFLRYNAILKVFRTTRSHKSSRSGGGSVV